MAVSDYIVLSSVQVGASMTFTDCDVSLNVLDTVPEYIVISTNGNRNIYLPEPSDAFVGCTLKIIRTDPTTNEYDYTLNQGILGTTNALTDNILNGVQRRATLTCIEYNSNYIWAMM